MLPISAITQGLSSYGIQPQLDPSATGMMAKIPGMDGVMDANALGKITEGLPISSPAGISDGLPMGGSSGEAFSSMLGKFIQDVNAKEVNASNAVNSLQSGGSASLHQAVIAMEEANVSFQLMVEVRNKLLDAYQELMRMQV